MTRWRLRIY